MVGTDNKNRHCDADRRKQSICRRLAALAESMDHRVASAMLLVMTKRHTGANTCMGLLHFVRSFDSLVIFQ